MDERTFWLFLGGARPPCYGPVVEGLIDGSKNSRIAGIEITSIFNIFKPKNKLSELTFKLF